MLIRWASPIILATAVVATPLRSFLPRDVSDKPRNISEAQPTYSNELLFEDTLEALRVMQDAYFEPWVGTWPKSIDWTAAVMGSHIAGALVSLSRGLQETYQGSLESYRAKENLISFYFSQLVGFYFGQNALSLRHQAYDDMLWVVLNWLDTIQFISEYTSTDPLGNSDIGQETQPSHPATQNVHNQSWHGTLWVPAFAHRARIFWELASKGWDETLCGGGMFWNPRLGPYKNAITNELFISASISMYKYFPGDVNASPYDFSRPNEADPSSSSDWQPHDPKYLAAAVKGYNWLMASNMTNKQGLFTDGFHMSNWPGNNSKCDRRDEQVYTYNQGVLLTSHLELSRTTGNLRYLRQGHKLIQDVIRATGWDLSDDEPADDIDDLSPGQLPPWHGLGRAGILEEICDPLGVCSQNSHTFKGIWMHHFTTFCAPFTPLITNTLFVDDHDQDVSVKDIRSSHREACQKYIPWIRHNALAARRTRDSEGKFGMWWTVGLLNITIGNLQIQPDSLPSTEGAVDYRTYGIPNDPMWMGPHPNPLPLAGTEGRDRTGVYAANSAQQPLGILSRRETAPDAGIGAGSSSDPNTRGRGRTVETQGGGLAVLRALWELLNQGE